MSGVTTRPTTRQDHINALLKAAHGRGLALRTTAGRYRLTRFGTHVAVELDGPSWYLDSRYQAPVGQEDDVAEYANTLVNAASAQRRSHLAAQGAQQ